MIPKVAGYRVLVDPAEIKEKWKSDVLDIVKVDETVDTEKRNTVIGKVLQVGADCYKKDACTEPWCKVGDMVLVNRGAGSQYYDKDDNEKLYLIVNEEDIQATFLGDI